jgi:hypothetical protein
VANLTAVRRLVVLLAGLALLATGAPSLAAQPRLQRQLLVFTYDGTGPGLLSVSGTVEANGRPGYLASVAAEALDGHLDPFFPDVYELGDGGAPAHTYGAAGTHDVCASPLVTCTADPGSTSLQFSIGFSVGESPRPVHLRMLIAVEGTKVKTASAKIGWKGTKRTGGFSRVTGGGTGFRAGGFAAEALPDASLRGGRKGSVAIAVPPCDQLGAGLLTLAGGRKDAVAACPTGPFTAAADGPARWSLTGDAAGVSSYLTRLIVVDL